VAFAKTKVRHVVLISNGILLDEGRVRSLLEAGVDFFELPLHAGDPATHDGELGCPGSFDRVTRAAATIRRHGGQIAFVFVGKRSNIGHWEAALEVRVALGARSFLLNRWNAGGACRAHPEELMPTVDQIRAALGVAEAGAQRYGVVISASIPLPPCLVDTTAYPSVRFGFCSAGGSQAYFTLDPLGFVRPCNHTPTVLGNLLEQPFHHLARSQALQAFVSARPRFCGGCAQELTCLGGCKAAAEVCYGDLGACEPFLALNLDRVQRPGS
jgi:radical SAM protein with 4Fe4S-binding SPASM domain